MRFATQTGISIHTEAPSGLDRARARVQNFDEQDIAWQIEVIRQNTLALPKSAAAPAKTVARTEALRKSETVAPTREIFAAEADKVAAELDRHAIRRGPGAAWIGLDWLGDAEVFQLVCLGQTLYNGASGITLFLAAHAGGHRQQGVGRTCARGNCPVCARTLRSRNAARTTRGSGIGGATGLGSVVYALSVMSTFLRDDDLLADAHRAAGLFTDDLIAADENLDVIGGSAGAILGLLRLHRDSRSGDVLKRAIKCGEHLLARSTPGPQGRRTWVGRGSGTRGLNGMSHGAAGFAYALAALAAATGREEFVQAASECIAFEDSSYDAQRHNWPDLRAAEPHWPCQWCHGAAGIGLARVATGRRGGLDSKLLATDIGNALAGVEQAWPAQVDTLCCGTLGSIEFFCEAGNALGRSDLRELAARRLLAVLQTAASTGDYRWNSGSRQFNLGLFRGLAGVGYTLLRQVDAALPNVLIWE